MSDRSSPELPTFPRRLETSEEFKILHNLVQYQEARVEGYVNQIIEECRIAMVISDRNPVEGVAGVDSTLFQALMELAQRLEPSKHGKLVQMVSELQTRTVTHPVTGKVLTFQGDAFFEDLPSLGWSELEAWDERGGQYHDVDNPNIDLQQQERWVNLNAFVAQLTQAAQLQEPVKDPQNVTKMDQSLRAIWVMTDALENDTRPLEELVRSAAVKAACMWFIYAARRLWQKVQNMVTYPEGYGAGPGRKYLQKDWMGHEPDRWLAWKRGLQSMKAVCTDEDMERLIGDAVKKMNDAMSANRSHEVTLTIGR